MFPITANACITITPLEEGVHSFPNRFHPVFLESSIISYVRDSVGEPHPAKWRCLSEPTPPQPAPPGSAALWHRSTLPRLAIRSAHSWRSGAATPASAAAAAALRASARWSSCSCASSAREGAGAVASTSPRVMAASSDCGRGAAGQQAAGGGAGRGWGCSGWARSVAGRPWCGVRGGPRRSPGQPSAPCSAPPRPTPATHAPPCCHQGQPPARHAAACSMCWARRPPTDNQCAQSVCPISGPGGDTHPGSLCNLLRPTAGMELPCRSARQGGHRAPSPPPSFSSCSMMRLY